jgi:hypothetical protein
MTRKLQLANKNIDIFFKGDKYRISVFNHEGNTPPRVVFMKIIKNSLPSSITIFEKGMLEAGNRTVDIISERGFELTDFIVHLNHHMITELLNGPMITLYPKKSFEERMDMFLDRYNDYLRLYELFDDAIYLKKANRMIYHAKKISTKNKKE